MTRALALSLGMQLPDVAVLTTSPIERPTWQVLVDVTAFEAKVDREVVLAARWTITDGSGRSSLFSGDAAVAESTENMDDATVVTAMSRAVERLASQIAAGIKRGRASGIAWDGRKEAFRGSAMGSSVDLDQGHSAAFR